MENTPLEIAQTIPAGDDLICGILHRPEKAMETGVLLMVGGPQTRVGSHRQFVLLARSLADRGIPVLRFDFRGMGDSSGEQRSFEQVNPDIGAAVERFFEESPLMKKVVIWGLCDAASAALYYAYKDERVQGLVLLNPWARSEAGEAKAYLKHYYLQRMISADFWKKVLGGNFKVKESLSSLYGMIRKMRGSNQPGDLSADLSADTESQNDQPKAGDKGGNIAEADQEQTQPFFERMRDGFEQFKFPVLLIISGNDLTASEFLDSVAQDRRWKKLLKRKQVTRKTLEPADHTFSKRQWRDQVADWTADWVLKLK